MLSKLVLLRRIGGGKEFAKNFLKKKWKIRTVNGVIKRFERRGTVDRKAGSGRKITASTPENIDAVTTLSYSQDDSPGTHLSQRRVAKRQNISQNTVKRILKKLGNKSVKRLITPQVGTTSRQRRVERSRRLHRTYTDRDVAKMCFQDEKDFTLQVPSNRQNNRVNVIGKKSSIAPERLYHPANKKSVKLRFHV